MEFDTPVVNFRLPPLTLQPIVENAVKYGLSPELEPLYISVLTEETAEGIWITVVEDDRAASGLLIILRNKYL